MLCISVRDNSPESLDVAAQDESPVAQDVVCGIGDSPRAVSLIYSSMLPSSVSVIAWTLDTAVHVIFLSVLVSLLISSFGQQCLFMFMSDQT